MSLGQVSQREAEVARQRKALDLIEGRAVQGSARSFGEFLPQYLAWHSAQYPDSHERVEQIISHHLAPVFSSYPMDELPHQVVEQWKAARLVSVSPATVTKELRTLQAIVNRAVEFGQILANPIKRVKPPRDTKSKAPTFYTPSQLLELYAAGPSYAHAWRFLANTGLRRQEALNARREHIRDGRLHVESTDQARTKSGKHRTIPLSDGARAALEHLGADYLFPRVNKVSISRAFARDAKRAGLSGTLHSLRHTYAANLVMAGVPLRAVQVLLGHSSVRITEQYAHLAPSYLDEQVTGLNL